MSLARSGGGVDRTSVAGGNLLGTREPGVHGSRTLADVEANCHDAAKTLGLTADFRRSNHEGS